MSEVTGINIDSKIEIEIVSQNKVINLNALSKNMLGVLITFSSLNDLMNIKFLNKKFFKLVESLLSKHKLYDIYTKLRKNRVSTSFIHNHFQKFLDYLNNNLVHLDNKEKFELFENYVCYRLCKLPKDSYRLSCNKIFVLKEHYVNYFMKFIASFSCHIQDLNLSYNDFFSQPLIKSLSDALRTNRSIKDLNLSSIKFPEDIKELANALTVNKFIEKLSCNDLCSKNSDKVISTLFEGLTFNKSIKEAYFCNYKNSKNFITSLTKCLELNISLKCLSISHLDLQDSGASQVFKSLMHNFSLTKLFITDNNITGEALRDLNELLNSNQTLMYLDISCNNFKIESFEYLYDIIEKNCSLEYLNISKCGVDNEVIKNLCKVMKKNKKLKNVHIFFNEITDDGLDYVIDLLNTNRNIHDFVISGDVRFSKKQEIIRKILNY